MCLFISSRYHFYVIYRRSLPPLSLATLFYRDLEQSALQLFKELSNPALDGSRAWRHNRILVLTLMTAPPAVAEPPVGSQEEYIGGSGSGGGVGGWRGRWLTGTD